MFFFDRNKRWRYNSADSSLIDFCIKSFWSILSGIYACIFKNIPKRFLVCLLWVQSKGVIYFIFRHFWPFQCNNPLQLSINLQIFVYFSSISLFSLVQTLFTPKYCLDYKFCHSWCLFFVKNMSFSRFSFLTIFLTRPK